MKKQFQILSIAIAIVFFSCGKHNAEISGTFTAGIKEFSIKSPSQVNEPDLLLMDNEGRIRFNVEQGDETNEIGEILGKGSNINDRSDWTIRTIRLNELELVN